MLEEAHMIATEIEMAIKYSLKSSVNIVTHLEPNDLHDDAHSEGH